MIKEILFASFLFGFNVGAEVANCDLYLSHENAQTSHALEDELRTILERKGYDLIEAPNFIEFKENMSIDYAAKGKRLGIIKSNDQDAFNSLCNEITDGVFHCQFGFSLNQIEADGNIIQIEEVIEDRTSRSFGRINSLDKITYSFRNKAIERLRKELPNCKQSGSFWNKLMSGI